MAVSRPSPFGVVLRHVVGALGVGTVTQAARERIEPARARRRAA